VTLTSITVGCQTVIEDWSIPFAKTTNAFQWLESSPKLPILVGDLNPI